MKVSLNWLREFVDFSSDANALAELLTMAGVEVEGVEQRGVTAVDVVVAQIVESAQHPNADRLSVCKVDDGSATPRQIVCGAKNYKVGDKVPLALPGAVLPGDPSTGSGQAFKIKIGKLRGVESQGMMCSAKELNLAEDAEGLLILPPEARVGAPLSELFPRDTILDLEITPNRPDLLSHLGIAREIAALTGGQLKRRDARRAELNYSHGVEIEAEECPFYTARFISDVKVGESPEWLRQRLEAAGLRPINNIVDITNFVMLERGQPLHAFDAERLDGDIRVRRAEEGEEFSALDGRRYTLRAQDLVIADARRAIAIAGVMGGAATGVTADTRRVWLESAYFLPSSIRRTSRRLGLVSDSSYRFEREVDPAGVLVASQRATDLICEIADGRAGELRLGFAANSQFGFDAEGAIEGVEYTNVVQLRPERCAALLGTEVPEEQIDEILTRFGLEKTDSGWQIPSFRSDLCREVDLIEEIARVVGIDAIPAHDEARFTPSSVADRAYDRSMELRRALVAHGFAEARTLTLISEKALQHSFFGGDTRRVRNPLNEDQVVLRPSLVPGLIEALGRNVRVGARTIRLFELGRVFGGRNPGLSGPADPELDLQGSQEDERTHLAIILTGPARASSWRESDMRDADLFNLKGVLAAALGTQVDFTASANDRLGLAAQVAVGGEAIGHAGQLWPAAARSLDATAPVVFAELDITELLAAKVEARRFRELPRFPSVTRDIAVLTPLALTQAEIVAVLRRVDEPLLASVELFDLFTDPTGARLPADKKSLAYSLTYRSPERTLTVDEVNAAHARLKERLKTELSVTLRE